MKIAIAGSSGLIGQALVKSLREDGHEVLRIVRRPSTAQTEVTWDPDSGMIELEKLEGTKVLINLAGAGVGDRRWSKSYKKLIHSSRINSTRTICQAALIVKPDVLINASAIGWYGETADQVVSENEPAGEGFLADVVRDWEEETQIAQNAGIRVVKIRTGLVVAKDGGAWAKILPIFKLGLGGKLGSGKQFWSFISLRDEIAAIKFLIANPKISGPVNLTAPNPATNTQVTKAMGKVLRRPTFFMVPAFMLKIVLGEFSIEVLGSTRVKPAVLLENGFEFLDPEISGALRTLIH